MLYELSISDAGLVTRDEVRGGGGHTLTLEYQKVTLAHSWPALGRREVLSNMERYWENFEKELVQQSLRS